MDPCPVPNLIRIGPSAIDGQGAFAVRDIPAGMPVVEYRGERVSKEESLRRCAAGNPFLFRLDSETDLDGAVPGNAARFVNHSCEPNCEAQRRGDEIWLVAIRDLRTGEEVTFNYGYDLTDWRSHPCRCGAPGCVGYMVAEDFFPYVRRLREYLDSAENGGRVAVGRPA